MLQRVLLRGVFTRLLQSVGRSQSLHARIAQCYEHRRRTPLPTNPLSLDSQDQSSPLIPVRAFLNPRNL